MTDQEHQAIILAETGTNSDSVVTSLLPLWWKQQVEAGRIGYLAYLYAKQSVLRYLLGIAKRRRDLVIGPNHIRAAQLFANAFNELKEWNTHIDRMDRQTPTAYIGTFTPTLRDDQLDVVEDALKFARQVNPHLDNMILEWLP